MFVNAMYLYDDKMTIAFNSGDDHVTIDYLLCLKLMRIFSIWKKVCFWIR
jgi:hypothetical protein